MFDWLKFFETTIERLQEPFSTVLLASGCREGWLQAELFRAGRQLDLRVNEYSLGGNRKADLSHGRPADMLGEIKIVAADHKPSMRDAVERDAARMKAVSSPGTQCYMILVVPQSTTIRGVLYDFLHSCSFSDRCTAREWEGFKLRIWQF